MSDGDQGPLSTAGCLHAQAPSMHTYHTHVLLYAYVPHTYHILVSSTSALAFSTRCKDKCTCHPIETSAHAFSICTYCPLKTLRLVRFQNLPASNLRERLFFTKDPKGASNVYQSVPCSNINHKCRKRTAKCTNSEEEKTKRSELNNSG